MVVTRFAPSPTGDLHIGSARTALYAWLYARHTKGKFILRIEDTDRERSTQGAIDVIFQGMEWMGLNWDEEPVFQTRRFDRYKEVIQQLVDQDLAYKCYCSKERLEKLRAEQMEGKHKPRYDGLCRKRTPDSPDDPYVIRFRNPEEGTVVFEDVIFGRIEVKNSELDDLIILRTDGSPTYNLTVVVDDWDMGVTHVLRGDDHINNTPRQINLLKAMGAPLPTYGHMPMLLGSDGKKLSKRHGAVSVLAYQERGILPQALRNYVVRLGWSHGDQEIFSLEEMIEKFDIKDINRSASAFNEEKLLWLNQHYMKTMPAEEVATHLVYYFEKIGINPKNGPDLVDIVPEYAERAKTLVELAESSRYLYEEFESYDEKAKKKLFNQESLVPLEAVFNRLIGLEGWTRESISDSIKPLSDELGLGLGKIMQPLRLAVTGGTVSPSIDITLQLLGKEKTLARLERAIKKIKA